MRGACEMSIWLCASVLLVTIKLDEPVGRKRLLYGVRGAVQAWSLGVLGGCAVI